MNPTQHHSQLNGQKTTSSIHQIVVVECFDPVSNRRWGTTLDQFIDNCPTLMTVSSRTLIMVLFKTENGQKQFFSINIC